MYPKLLSIGNITIYTYGLFVALGIIAGFNLALKTAKHRSLSRDFMNYLITVGVIAGIVGARIAYVAIAFDDYADNIFRIIMFWEGGLVFWRFDWGSCLDYICLFQMEYKSWRC